MDSDELVKGIADGRYGRKAYTLWRIRNRKARDFRRYLSALAKPLDWIEPAFDWMRVAAESVLAVAAVIVLPLIALALMFVWWPLDVLFLSGKRVRRIKAIEDAERKRRERIRFELENEGGEVNEPIDIREYEGAIRIPMRNGVRTYIVGHWRFENSRLKAFDTTTRDGITSESITHYNFENGLWSIGWEGAPRVTITTPDGTPLIVKE